MNDPREILNRNGDQAPIRGAKAQGLIIDAFDESAPMPGTVIDTTFVDPGVDVTPRSVAEGDEELDAPRHFYVSITPGGIKLRYAGSVRTKGELAFYQVYFGIYGPTFVPANVETMRDDFKTKRRNVFDVHTLPEYLGEHVRRHRGKWVVLKD